MRKGLIKLMILAVLVVAGAVAIYLTFDSRKGWNLDIFGGEVEIDETKNVVEQIRQISELTTMCYYQECVVKKHKMEPTFFDGVSKAMHLGGDSCRRDIVVIAKGTVRAGFDLTKVAENDIRISSDTLYVSLPKAEVLDVISNPSDFEVYYEDGKWSHGEITKIQKEAAEDVRNKAVKDGILNKASASGINKLTAIFGTLGFKAVVVDVCNR